MSTYLGLDSSTQGLKALLVDEHRVLECESVSFGVDLPQYLSPDGFLPSEDPEVCLADPLMWAAALELLLERMQRRGVDFSTVRAISGSGQQHGSVYLNDGFLAALHSLRQDIPLHDQLAPVLSRRLAPIWRDHSTGRQCRELTERFGESGLQARTGSVATERFTGPQIMKFAQESPEAWRKTARVHLVSSFMCSLLCGGEAAIDYGDGAGMNLLNLQRMEWDSEIANAMASELLRRLPRVVPSNAVVGNIAPFFQKYGFRPDTAVAVWSGDNPCSLVGIGAATKGTIGISLGTSDTIFAPMEHFRTVPDGSGHVFGNPAGGFMSLTCFANGALARDAMRKEHGMTWEQFGGDACLESHPGSDGRLMLPYYAPECTPSSPAGIRRNYDPAQATPAENVRVLLESQAQLMRYHSQWTLDDGGSAIKAIRLTGGGSKSAGFCQILADVFQADVELLENSNAAALGAALRAINSVTARPFEELASEFCRPVACILYHPDYKDIYDRQAQALADWRKSI